MAAKLTWRDLQILAICIWGEITYRVMWGTASFNQDEQKYGHLTYREQLDWISVVTGYKDDFCKDRQKEIAQEYDKVAREFMALRLVACALALAVILILVWICK